MPDTLAYVMSGHRNVQMEADARGGKHPRMEYQLFLERNPATLLDFSVTEAFASPRSRYFIKRGWHSIAIAEAVLTRGAHGGTMATGEDIGLPLALLAILHRSNNPIYIITHGSYCASPKFKWIMRLLRSRRHVHFLTLSESLRSMFVTEFAVSPDRVHNCGYAADTAFFRPQEWPQTPLIVSAGAANRDYPTLVQAVQNLDVEVQIAAGSTWFPQMAQFGAAESLPAHVTVQARNYVELRALYAAASFVVVPLHPARHACGYAVIADAMAMGKAVIATRTEHPSDFLVEGETGFYVEPHDAAALRAKIDFLLAHPEEAERMGCAAQARMQQYSLENYCHRLEEVVNRFGPGVPALRPA